VSERHFWMVMHYGCDRCGHELEFYLEDGCEGPKDRQAPIPREWERLRARTPKFIRDTLPSTVAQTDGGRYVLPVPFIAAPCPKCQPGQGRKSLRGGILQHVEWDRDRMVDTTEPPPTAGRFLYPDDWYADQACGHPVMPGEVAHG